MNKKVIDDLAIFGGAPLFREKKSTSNLVRPDIDVFLNYSKEIFQSKKYSNNGNLLRNLESRLALFHNTKYCVAFNSGFWALAIAIRELHLKGKKEVIIPSLTYRRLADIILWAGLKPRFCDVDKETLAVSRDTVEPNINHDTALILAVHPVINTCDVYGIVELCKERAIPLLFDSVESVYESICGVKTGGFGLGECFSLHASKLINGFEGGYLTTNHEWVYDRLKYLRGFGFNSPDHILGLGINAKMNEVHAAMALACLDNIESQVGSNKRKYKKYQGFIDEFEGMRLVEFNEDERTSYKNILVEVTGKWEAKRDLLVSMLNKEGILSRAYYNPPLHHKHGLSMSDCVFYTDDLSMKFILMPCGDHVTESDLDLIGEFLVYIYEHFDEICVKIEGGYGL